ncbi:hypothetical protein SAMN05518871_1019 [Psychrobacillus sp. OK028]|uniref:hypothetical protein n=1 Tax=Psychrobacillus sp. OK028 TaxID=1884359 RepID=UPI00088C6E99|nr:hypothetical protein [Psychrobacillus sp. OK028]SDM35026.1 hypothetical protein SAMN05518871_1019 [Psychrobacillus sp. OK028]
MKRLMCLVLLSILIGTGCSSFVFNQESIEEYEEYTLRQEELIGNLFSKYSEHMSRLPETEGSEDWIRQGRIIVIDIQRRVDEFRDYDTNDVPEKYKELHEKYRSIYSETERICRESLLFYKNIEENNYDEVEKNLKQIEKILNGVYLMTYELSDIANESQSQ